jgi:enterochelin esterase-like enzyme
MFFSGTSGGGAWSLKTFLPFLSSHCHWALAESGSATTHPSTSQCTNFIPEV